MKGLMPLAPALATSALLLMGSAPSPTALAAELVAPHDAGAAPVGTETAGTGVPVTLPAGFNPVTATAAQLNEYGFPPRPSNASALAVWENAMKHAVTRISTPYSTSGPSALPLAGSIGQIPSPWAGYQANSSNNSDVHFTDALVQFGVPRVPSDSSITSYSQTDPQVGFWVGLGGLLGSEGGNLWQAGVLAVSEKTPQYYTFWEYAPHESWQDAHVPVSPGQTVFVEVWLNDGGDVPQGHVYIENITTGQYLPTNAGMDISSSVSGTFSCTAEWPQYTKSQSLPDYGTMTFDSCSAAVNSTSYFQTMNSFNYYQNGDWCYNSSGTNTARVQVPDALQSGGDFLVKWLYGGNPCVAGAP
jgi:hypothetical protein